MSASPHPYAPRPARALSALIGRVIEPVTARRGFASADLLGAWAELVGPRFADCCQPERIQWPRQRDAASAGTLFIRVDGGRAVYLQHELGPLRERINTFLGFRAVGEIRIVQAPLATTRKQKGPEPAATPAQLAFIEKEIEAIEDEGLKASLRELGQAVLAADNKT